jgi:hypothetical protein
MWKQAPIYGINLLWLAVTCNASSATLDQFIFEQKQRWAKGFRPLAVSSFFRAKLSVRERSKLFAAWEMHLSLKTIRLRKGHSKVFISAAQHLKHGRISTFTDRQTARSLELQ